MKRTHIWGLLLIVISLIMTIILSGVIQSVGANGVVFGNLGTHLWWWLVIFMEIVGFVLLFG